MITVWKGGGDGGGGGAVAPYLTFSLSVCQRVFGHRLKDARAQG